MSDPAIADNNPIADYECMPIFRRFPREVLEDMAALEWTPETSYVSGSLQSPRATTAIVVPGELVGEEEAQQFEETVCPIGYCLYRIGKLWLTKPEYAYDSESEHYVEIDGVPDAGDIADMLLGRSYAEHATTTIKENQQLAAYQEIFDEAGAFIRAWDEGKLPIPDLPKAACLHLSPEEAASPVPQPAGPTAP